MNKTDLLNNKMVLVVDDEQDILDTIEEDLDTCIVHKAKDFATALQFLMGYTYDIVILDIMGVNGFELLKTSVSRGFPTLMLTAHAVTPEALKSSIKLGAVFFLPKERMVDLKGYLEEVILEGGKPIWVKLFDRLGSFFNKRFGPDWMKKDQFFQEFQEILTRSEKHNPS